MKGLSRTRGEFLLEKGTQRCGEKKLDLEEETQLQSRREEELDSRRSAPSMEKKGSSRPLQEHNTPGGGSDVRPPRLQGLRFGRGKKRRVQ